MNRTMKEMIKDIKKASERDKLVIFIGAGVSANSGYKLWDSLIGTFNADLSYSPRTKQFTTDEMLKIPQFFYNKDKEKYFEIVKQEYGKPIQETNAIIDALLQLKPAHIITTNFDLLIEKSLEENPVYGNTVHGNLGKYSIIKGDGDFIHATKGNYLIKMHGDITSIENLILKEEDYLQFSSTHMLIETFIKSLFVNHTFLFVGYGLGDYNIKLIMSWVDSVLKYRMNEDESERFSYYFINADPAPLSDYEKDYYKKKNIFVLESSEMPNDLLASGRGEKHSIFENAKGNNLLRACDYIIYAEDNNIAEIMRDLSVFDDINCITNTELALKLNSHSHRTEVNGSTLNYYSGLLSTRQKVVFDELKERKESVSAKYFAMVFAKAGINEITSIDDDTPAIKIENSTSIQDELFDSVINCDIRRLYELAESECQSQRERLQSGYIFALLGDDDKAIDCFREAITFYIQTNDFFHLLICNQNLCKVSMKEKHRWYLLKDSLSLQDRETFKTLYDYLNNSTELYIDAVDTFKKLEQKFDADYYSFGSDENNILFIKLRYRIHQIQRYFISNSIYIRGYSGHTSIIGNWLTTLDCYTELLLMLHSSNARMEHEKRKYRRNELKEQDVYLLVTHPDSRQLKYLIEKYNVRQFSIEKEVEEYVLCIFENYISSFAFESVVHFKLVHEMENLLMLIPLVNFSANQYIKIFQKISEVFTSILQLPYSKKEYLFRSLISTVMQCIFSLLQQKKERVEECFLQRMIENILLCVSTSTDIDAFNYQVEILKEHRVLLNFSTGLSYYYNAHVFDGITDGFLNAVNERIDLYLKGFIIDLFPMLSEAQKEKWRELVCIDISDIEPEYIRFAVIHKVFEYDDNICSILVNLCQKQMRGKRGKDNNRIEHAPLQCVLRLFEKGLIHDIEPFKKFRDQYDLFDFVCFPKEFNYERFDTRWGSWLTWDKIRAPAFECAFDILKEKYREKMGNGPSEAEKATYYKYFYLT